MQQPLVSICIPTYRRPEYLLQAIESARSQTYRNTEILVSDSEGSDEVAALVASRGDPRLRYRRNDTVTDLRENALAMYRDARGELVATLHDDDYWEPRFLERLVPPLVEDPSLVLSFCDHYVMDQNGEVSLPQTERTSRRWRRTGLDAGRHQPFYDLAVVTRAIPFAVTTVFRTSWVDLTDVPQEVGPAYDLWFSYLACRSGGGAYYVAERLTRYREHSGSTTATTRVEPGIVYCYDRFLADPRLSLVHAALRKESADYRVSLGLSAVRAGDRGSARRHLRTALRDGQTVPALVGLALSYLPATTACAGVDAVRQVRRATVGAR